MTRRTDRVADLVRAELSQIVLRRLQDPRVRLTTITDVNLSPDLRHARVGISVVGDEAERQASLDALQHAAGYLRRQLAHSLSRMKNVPELKFELDRGAEYTQRISELLENPDEHDEST